jgi:hypothetical protein
VQPRNGITSTFVVARGTGTWRTYQRACSRIYSWTTLPASSDVLETPNTLRKGKEHGEVEIKGVEARNEIIRENEQLEEGRSPHPDKDDGVMKRTMDVGLTDVIRDVWNLKTGREKPHRNDPATFIGMLTPLRAEPNEGTRPQEHSEDELSTKSLPPFPTPIASNLSLIIQGNQYRYSPCSSAFNNKSTLRTCICIPYPDSRPTRLKPPFKFIHHSSFDPLNVATTVAAAKPTPVMAKEGPDTFIKCIGMREIPKKPWKDVERTKAGPVRTGDIKVIFEGLVKSARTLAPPTEPRAMRSQQQPLNNPIIDIPPSIAKIIPAALPTIQPTDIQHNVGINNFLVRDTVMEEPNAGVTEGEAATDEETKLTGDDFEHISNEGMTTGGELV